MRSVLQGAVSGYLGWLESLWPKSSSSQVVFQNCCVRCGRCQGLKYHTPSLPVSLLSGKRVGGQTALEMGLVNRAVEQNQTGDAAHREALCLAREILPQVGMLTHYSSRLKLRCSLARPLCRPST